MLDGKDTTICLLAGQIKKDIVEMGEYFPEPKSLGGRVKVELDLGNYAKKTFLKGTQKLPKKVNLAHLKSNVDKLDIDKLKNVPSNLSHLKSKADKLDVDKLVPFPVDLSKLSDLVKRYMLC